MRSNVSKFLKSPVFNKKSRVTRRLEDIKLNLRRQAIDANTKMTEMLELPDKDFKAATVKMLQ